MLLITERKNVSTLFKLRKNDEPHYHRIENNFQLRADNSQLLRIISSLVACQILHVPMTKFWKWRFELLGFVFAECILWDKNRQFWFNHLPWESILYSWQYGSSGCKQDQAGLKSFRISTVSSSMWLKFFYSSIVDLWIKSENSSSISNPSWLFLQNRQNCRFCVFSDCYAT